MPDLPEPSCQNCEAYKQEAKEARQFYLARFKEMDQRLNAYAEKRINETWNEALEMAAVIVDKQDSGKELCAEGVANRIRGLKIKGILEDNFEKGYK